MSRRKGTPSTGWDAVIRALAGIGYDASLDVDCDGRLIATEQLERTLHEALAQGIAFMRCMAAAAAREHAGMKPDARIEALLAQTPHTDMAGLLGLGALAWRDLAGTDGAHTPLKRLMEPPSTAPIAALALDRATRATFEAQGPTHPPIAEPLAERVFYVEITGDRGRLPRGVVRWERPVAGAPVGIVHVAAIWTEGEHASSERPLVVTMRWMSGESDGRIGAIRIPRFGTKELDDPPLDEIAKERGELMKTHVIATIMHRAMAAWVHAASRGAEPGGFRARAGHRRIAKGARTAKQRARELAEFRRWSRGHSVLELTACPRGTQERSRSLPAEPATGLDALLMSAARATDSLGYGGGEAARVWSDAWWHRAEQGLITWHTCSPMAEHAELVDGRYAMLGGELSETLKRPCARAIRCATEFGWKVLTATGRAALIHAQAPGTVYGLRVPERLWRAIGEAGPYPEPQNIFADDAWWYVEIEHREPHEPRGIGLWEHIEPDGTRLESGMAIWTEPAPATPHTPFIAGWRWPAEADGPQPSWAWIEGEGKAPLAPGTPGYPYHADPDIEETATVLLGAALAGSGGALERARAAITEHLTRGTSTAMALAIAPAPLREANRPRWIARTHDAPDPRNESIFMLMRAPDPVRVDDTGTGEIGNGKDGEREPQGPLRERHYVRAHWKRQAHGPGGRLRKIVCIEGYWRGPEPDDEHLTLERMAEHHHPSGETRE